MFSTLGGFLSAISTNGISCGNIAGMPQHLWYYHLLPHHARILHLILRHLMFLVFSVSVFPPFLTILRISCAFVFAQTNTLIDHIKRQRNYSRINNYQAKYINSYNSGVDIVKVIGSSPTIPTTKLFAICKQLFFISR